MNQWKEAECKKLKEVDYSIYNLLNVLNFYYMCSFYCYGLVEQGLRQSGYHPLASKYHLI